jgi:hypothetical protein
MKRIEVMLNILKICVQNDVFSSGDLFCRKTLSISDLKVVFFSDSFVYFIRIDLPPTSFGYSLNPCVVLVLTWLDVTCDTRGHIFYILYFRKFGGWNNSGICSLTVCKFVHIWQSDSWNPDNLRLSCDLNNSAAKSFDTFEQVLWM